MSSPVPHLSRLWLPFQPGRNPPGQVRRLKLIWATARLGREAVALSWATPRHRPAMGQAVDKTRTSQRKTLQNRRATPATAKKVTPNANLFAPHAILFAPNAKKCRQNATTSAFLGTSGTQNGKKFAPFATTSAFFIKRETQNAKKRTPNGTTSAQKIKTTPQIRSTAHFCDLNSSTYPSRQPSAPNSANLIEKSGLGRPSRL